MKRYILLVAFAVFAIYSSAQMNPWVREWAYDRPYSVALTLTNPANAMSRLGVGIEYRRRNYSYMSTYNLYTGVYEGKMQDFNWTFYLGKIWRHRVRRAWYHQDFIYTKLFSGDAEYIANKFQAIGLPTPSERIIYDYIGAGAGYGRRYMYKAFFISVRAGLRGTYVGADGKYDGIAEEDKVYYRLFYLTGPGSIIECTANFGIQL
ncbi:MAG: hypothetical protein IAE95_04295 [Chitinophagaceae bacterium]|nr:hypothetical protein [Chitinophagaceae bacterium]